MAKRIIWSKNALKNRQDILNYWNIYTGSTKYSIKLNKQFKEIIEYLKIFPMYGKKYKTTPYRYILLEAYQIIYLIKDKDIYILHLWDNRRNPSEFGIKV